jgi:hypothetical protein
MHPQKLTPLELGDELNPSTHWTRGKVIRVKRNRGDNYFEVRANAVQQLEEDIYSPVQVPTTIKVLKRIEMDGETTDEPPRNQIIATYAPPPTGDAQDDIKQAILHARQLKQQEQAKEDSRDATAITPGITPSPKPPCQNSNSAITPVITPSPGIESDRNRTSSQRLLESANDKMRCLDWEQITPELFVNSPRERALLTTKDRNERDKALYDIGRFAGDQIIDFFVSHCKSGARVSCA